jgi:dihydrofolate synthase/folylpolyglutamate synthase
MLEALPAPLRVPVCEAAPHLERVRLPGRFQRSGKYIFDVAHNPDGSAVLGQTLAHVAPPAPIWVLLTVLNDKDWRGMMRALAPHVAGFVLTTSPTAPESRAWSPSEAFDFAVSNGITAMLVPDFDRALARADAEGATVLITGSFHTVGDAMLRLQVDPLAR